MKYKRAFIPGGTFFFTVVTYNRQKLFFKPENVELLRSAFRYVMQSHPFTLFAIVILPDHIHAIWILPPQDADFSTRWRLIKTFFSRNIADKPRNTISLARKNKSEQMIGQRRFWEHVIHDELDLVRHVDYIHFNPVKHGLSGSPIEWPYSSFKKFVQQGIYSIDWGSQAPMDFNIDIGME